MKENTLVQINWLLRGDHPHLASNRYRAVLPARGLRALGHTVNMLYLSDLAPCDGVLVVGKLWVDRADPMFVHRQLIEAYIDDASARGVRVVADISDNHFEAGTGSYYRALVQRVHAVTAGSEAMAQAVRRYTDKPVHVVGDPVASPLGEPTVARNGWLSRTRLKIVWYGTINNVTPMERWAFQLGPLGVDVTLVTAENKAVRKLVDVFGAECPKSTMRFVPWSEEAQWAAVREAHVVCIPTEVNNPAKVVKSANRLTDALHAGRFVIATPLPAYEPFREFVTLTADPVAAVRWYRGNHETALTMVSKGREAALAACGLDVIAKQWQAALLPVSNQT